MKPYICQRCGGTINRAKMICEYCGTAYQDDNGVIRIEAYRPGVHTLGSNVVIDKEFANLSPKEASEMAIRIMAKEFADGIAQFMEVRTMDYPGKNEILFSAKLRVLDSGYRFE